MKRVLGMGNALIDVLVQAESDDLLRELQLPKGSMQLIGSTRYRELQQRFASLSPRRTTGGSACNTLLALAHLGAAPGLMAKVGDDEAGRFFADSCQREGIRTHLLCQQGMPTGVASTVITPDGQRTFGTCLGAAATMQANELCGEWFDGYHYFYIEGYLVQNHDLMRRAVSLAREAGLKVCIDLASYNVVEAERSFFDEMLQHTDIVFANEQEAAALTGTDDPSHNLQALSGICSLAVLKVGRQGVWVQQGSEQLHCPAHNVPQVTDTTAAGDYFAAGFLYGLIQDRSLAWCAEAGSLLAAHIIQVVGTALPHSTWHSLRQTLAVHTS
ncbi:MAG: adenosine kinase [Alloprevotella sp.]